MRRILFCTSCGKEAVTSISVYPMRKGCKDCGIKYSVRKSAIGGKVYIKRDDGVSLIVGDKNKN